MRQALYCWAYWSRRRLWFSERGILRKGSLASSSSCSRQLRTVELGNKAPVAVTQRSSKTREGAERSGTAMRIRCLSSGAAVLYRVPLPGFCLNWFSSVHFFQIRITVVLLHCVRAANSRYENPPSHIPMMRPRGNSFIYWYGILRFWRSILTITETFNGSKKGKRISTFLYYSLYTRNKWLLRN